MAAETDRLLLTNRKLFRNFRSKLAQSTCLKTRNIIECKDDILYVWNTGDFCVFTLNVKTSTPDTADAYQTLLPTDPPGFDVERLLVNETASQLAVFGPRGVAVFDLPRRWGRDALFAGGKSVVQCRCRPVDSRFFACNPHVELRAVRWHPGSPSDGHLLALTSDNAFRLYDTASGGDVAEPRLQQVWRLGHTPTPRLPVLAGLGDTAVDFDFARPIALLEDVDKLSSSTAERARSQVDGGATLWPILVLRGNGDVFSVTSTMTSEGMLKASIHGPLVMYPPDDDNYGVDSCSILCLKTEPPLVVIATCSGTLYHCLLLGCDASGDTKLNDTTLGSNFSLHSAESALHVFESVELELGLSLNDSDEIYNCPIHLHHDQSTKARYFCSHDTGIHAMTLPLVPQLQLFLQANHNQEDQLLPSLSLPSCVEYLVCTSSSVSAVSPLLGLTFTQTPAMVVALLCSGEVVSLPLVTMPVAAFNALASAGDDVEPQPVTTKEQFIEHIRRILKHGETQPILKFGPNSELTSQESLELVNRSTNLLREEYFLRHDKARDEIERRVLSLRAAKQHQLAELRDMEQQKQALQEGAENLAEKYEDIKDKQEALISRAENVLRCLSRKQPSISAAEKKLSAELRQVKAKMESYARSMEQVKARLDFNKSQQAQLPRADEAKERYLSPVQLTTTKLELAQVTEDLTELRRQVSVVKKELNI